MSRNWRAASQAGKSNLGKFRFNQFQHDSGSKTVLGKTATFEEGQSIDWILEQPQAARFIVGKLYRQFVCDEPAPPPQLLEPLANELREHEWQISPSSNGYLAVNFSSPRMPWDAKCGRPLIWPSACCDRWMATTNTHQLAADLEQNGQGLFFPPNVKGWDGGRTWIKSSTILGRANMTARLIGDEKYAVRRRQAGRVFRTPGSGTNQNKSLIADPVAARRAVACDIARRVDRDLSEEPQIGLAAVRKRSMRWPRCRNFSWVEGRIAHRTAGDQP